MAENKQHQLNGAFYGPSIPPPQRTHHHRGRTCCSRIFNIFWKTILAIIILIVLAFVIFLVIVQPRPFKFHVTEAKLMEFNYTNNTLHYNLELNFTARNPNKKLGIYYDKVEGNAFYDGSRFSTIDVITWLNSFRQDAKHTDRMSGVFKGQKVLVLDQGQISEFDQDKRGGAFGLYVKLHFTIRFRLGDFIFNNLGSRADAKCRIKVPLSGSNGKVVGNAFEPTKCHVNVKWF